MSLTEMADYLKIARAELEEMAESGAIPGTKVSSQWRFMRSMVDNWLIDYMKRLGKDDLRRLIATDGGPLSLRTLLRPAHVSLDIEPGSKQSVLMQLVDILCRDQVVGPEEADRLVERLLDREEMVSTAIFPGVALPHPRNPAEKLVRRPAVALGVCRPGTEFDSLDMASTHVFFLVCAGNEILHLKLIAEIALHLRKGDFVERALGSAEPAKILAELFAQ
jgi:PTS system nitrogen regulatory IIA component